MGFFKMKRKWYWCMIFLFQTLYEASVGSRPANSSDLYSVDLFHQGHLKIKKKVPIK